MIEIFALISYFIYTVFSVSWVIFKKYKTFFVLIYSYFNTSAKIGKRRNCVKYIHTISSFFQISTNVDRTVYRNR